MAPLLGAALLVGGLGLVPPAGAARDDDDAFAAMKKHFSEKQIVELTVFCGMWNYSNRLCEALHVDLERPDKRIEFQE